MADIFYTNQYFTTTLNVGGGIDNSQTTGIILSGVSGLDITKPGIALFSYADPLVTSTAEWITYTSIDGSNELQGVTRGAEGFSAKAHANGVTVAFPLSESHINNMADVVTLYNDISTSVASDATPNPVGSKRINEYYLTALGEAAEFAAPSGTPANGNKLIIRILDDGTGRALTYNAIYRAVGITLPTTTTASKTTYIGAIYNSADSKWDCIATGTEA